MRYLTAKQLPVEDLEFLDCALYPPPKATKLLLLSRYGIATVGTYQPGFHLGWLPLPTIPSGLRNTLARLSSGVAGQPGGMPAAAMETGAAEDRA